MPKAGEMTVRIDGGWREQWEAAMRARGLVPITLYADGSCPESSRRPGEAPMGVGVVAVSGALKKEWSAPVGPGTNIRAEVLAIQFGLKRIKQPANAALRLISDSEWSLAALAGTYKIKKNVDLVFDTRSLLEAIPHRELIHVPGHAGYEGNERCDLLAGMAVRTQTPWHGFWRGGLIYDCAPEEHELSALAALVTQLVAGEHELSEGVRGWMPRSDLRR